MKLPYLGSMGPQRGGIGGNHVLTSVDHKEKLILYIFQVRSGADPCWGQKRDPRTLIGTIKIAGRMRPALVDPSHKVRQGGKGSVWDGQTYGWTDGHFQSTSGSLLTHFRSLPVHFQSTSGSLLVHLGTIGGHMRHHSYSLPKKLTFAKLLMNEQKKSYF